MIKQVVLLSGHVSSGKTTLAGLLQRIFELQTFKTVDYLKTLDETLPLERNIFQDFGEKLDKKTKGGWVCDGLQAFVRKKDLDNEIIVVDSVRIKEQIDVVRRIYRENVIHIHLDAPIDELKKRYKKRKPGSVTELSSYDEVLANKTESQVDDLKKVADVVINTGRCLEDDVMIKAASHLGLYGRGSLRLVDILIGGQYGSEGKGHIASYLAREYDCLMRVGGPNAGHTVFNEPAEHTFHHLPSGCMIAPYTKLLIGPGATIYIPDLIKEISKYEIGCDRLSIDPQVMIITDEDRNKEAELVESMGSTGRGVGAATARRILGRVPEKVKLAKDFNELKPFIRESYEVLEDTFCNGKKVLLEGTQGTFLSLYHGIYPYVTSRDTTVAGCLAEAGISPSRTRKIIMVCRTHPIRVQNPRKGTSGPMKQPLGWTIISKRSGINVNQLRGRERTTTTKRRRRIGEFEWTSLRKAAFLNAPTDIALTFVDYISKKNKEARRFEQLTEDTISFIEEVERVASAPVSLISTRFDYPNRSIIDRRSW